MQKRKVQERIGKSEMVSNANDFTVNSEIRKNDCIVALVIFFH